MTFVNYGAPVIAVRESVPGPLCGFVVRAQHDGPDGHDQLQPGEQCECGQLGLGIIRDSEPNRTNNFQPFYESFASVERSGIDAIFLRHAAPKRTRRQRLWRWLTIYRGVWPTWLREPKMKPCVPVHCPPLEVHEIHISSD